MDVTRIVVDSTDRDRSTHPTPASYVVHLPYDIFNVCSVRLVSALMPTKPAYLVGAGEAQRVSVALSSGQRAVAELPYGDYASATDLAHVLRDALNAAAASAGADNVFVVSVSARLDRYEIRSTTAFSIDATAMHPATVQMLGLRPGAAQAATYDPADPTTPFICAMPFRKCLDAPYRSSAVLRLQLPSAELLVSASQTLNRSFAILSPGASDRDATGFPYVKRWAAPVGRLSRFHVEFVDVFGGAYDFQNQDHRLEFLVESAPSRPMM
jgi:hypothetical protein